MNYKIIIGLSLFIYLLIGCGDTEFRGQNRKRSDAAQTQTPTKSQPPSQIQSDPPSLGTAPPGNATPDLPDLSLPDLPDVNLDLSWGSAFKAWHIGDNNMKDTSCKIRVFTNIIDSDKSANFYFRVERPQTSLDIVALHCGAEGAARGWGGRIELLDAQSNRVVGNYRYELEESQNILFFKKQRYRVTLNPGEYKIRISTEMNSANGDYDDMVVRAAIENATGPIYIDKTVKPF